MSGVPVEIIGVGSPIMDLIVAVSEAQLAAVGGEKGGMCLVDGPAFEALLRQVPAPHYTHPGGSAANTVFALAQLGVGAAHLGKLGTDARAARYRAAFDEIGGDGSRFKAAPGQATACCLSLVTPDSERTMRTHLGAAALLRADEITPADFAGARHVHVEGYLAFTPDLLQGVLRCARAAGCRISLDLGSFEVVAMARETLPGLLAECVDIVFANEDEAAAFCGDRDPRAGLAALGALCEIAAVKLGAEGAWVQSAGEVWHIPARLATHVVDTTAAGDFWAAGFLYGHLRGYPLSACGALGAHISCHVVQHPGAALPAAAWDELRAACAALEHEQGVVYVADA